MLCDSYVPLGVGEVESLVACFAGRTSVVSTDRFRIDRVRNNPAFVRWIPATIEYRSGN